MRHSRLVFLFFITLFFSVASMAETKEEVPSADEIFKRVEASSETASEVARLQMSIKAVMDR